ncbi:MAG: uncharacterized protein QOD74_1505 [Variibacter sp.]|nr:uncharacterized protein [Variibacter sp.]
MPNTFVWYELVTTNHAGAERFYRDVIGWKSESWGPNGDYKIMMMGESRVGGIMTLPKEACDAGARPCWLGYIGVTDLASAVDKLKKAGGEVHKDATAIPEIGSFAAVADPTGAAFILFQPNGSGTMPDTSRTPGHVGWHELYAGDGPKAYEFYAGQYGWTKDQAMDMGAMGVYQLFAAGAGAIGGIMTKPAEVPMPAWIYYFNVEAIDAAAERVRKAGGQILKGPMEVPGPMWIVQCFDPQGAMFALVAPQR